ncbi:glycosyltransferase [Hamadaea sp. NPDC051192]|uniref:glycosyltransferase n=1 Tax=Hamadaea sp. NPDC051192 TaxID=3154940 RepID=UPI003441849E
MSHTDRSPSMSAYAGQAMPDSRLASMFAPRSTTAPISATSIGMLGAYTSDRDGVTTFSAHLRQAMLLDRPNTSITVVTAGETMDVNPPEVVHQLNSTSAGSRPAAAVLSQNDAVLVHYQDGVYGGTEGDQILDVLQWITVPVVVIIHDLHPQPSARRRFIIEMLTTSADAVVTMSETGRRILLDEYRVEPRKLIKIQHGAEFSFVRPDQSIRPRHRPRILTWGLLGPDCGVELGLRAVAQLRAVDPPVHYCVAGPLDPALDRSQANAYRASLLTLADELGIADTVEWQIGPLHAERLSDLAQRADVILLPQSPADRTASAILADAITAARPIVANGFPYATEILPDTGGGIVATEPATIADALTRIITNQRLSTNMADRNAALAPALDWTTAAGQYRQLVNVLLRRPADR